MGNVVCERVIEEMKQSCDNGDELGEESSSLAESK
jgi:hypothetical protein